MAKVSVLVNDMPPAGSLSLSDAVHLYTRNPQGDLVNVTSDVLVELEDVFDYIEEKLDDDALTVVAERIFDEFVAGTAPLFDNTV